MKTSKENVPLSTKRSVGDLHRRKLTAVQRRLASKGCAVAKVEPGFT